jgi:hypothetical protein
VFAHVAESDGAIVGTALWFETYSTRTGRPSLYLEDRFVEPAARPRHRACLVRGARAGSTAARLRLARLLVLDWSETAQSFYRAIGGFRATGWEP